MEEALCWNRCFICSSPLDIAIKIEGSEESSLHLNHSTSINNSLLTHKTLFQYLLCDSKQDTQDPSTNKEGENLVRDIIQLDNQIVAKGASAPSVGVGFCSFCNRLAEQVKDLQLQLEVIQMKLIDKLKTVKQCVLSNSRLYGSNDEVRLQFQKFEDQLEQQASAGEECENERKLLDVLHRFQTFIFESDIQLRNIPLVYLTKYMGGGTVPLPSPQNATADTSIVKHELVDDSDISDYEDEFEDTTYCHDLDTQLAVREEWLYPAITTRELTSPSSPPTRRKGEGKIAKSKPMVNVPVKQAKLSSETKITKTVQLTVPVKSSSSRTVASTSTTNELIEDVRNYELRDQATKAVKPTTSKNNESEPLLTEAQKLAKVIRLKRNANCKGMTKSEKQIIDCEECSYASNRPSRMEQHFREHEGTEDERNLECPDCKKRFKHNQYFEFHITHYCGMRKWKCDICIEYIYRVRLKEHVDEHHEGKLHHCDQCDYMFVSFLNLVAHKRYHVHEADSKHVCVECPEPKTFTAKVNLLRHLHEDHGHTELAMKCNYENCSAIFYFRTSLSLHHNVHEGRFTCEVCNKSFGSTSFLERHIRSLHTFEKPFNCEHCNERFTSKRSLESHMRVIHNVVKHKCDICSKVFSERNLLKHHEARDHGIGELQQYPCNVCGKTFSHRKNFNAHKITHIDKNEFTCDVCGYATKTRSRLGRHMLKHNGEKKHVCSYCPKSFAVKEYLQDHLRTHTLERPFQCEICGTSFNHRGALNMHKKRHLDDKPFVPKGPRPRLKKKEFVSSDSSLDANQNSNEVPECSATVNDSDINPT